MQTRYGLQELLLAAAGYAGHAQYLTRVGGEGQVVYLGDAVLVLHCEVLDLEAALRVLRLGALDVQHDGAADHHVGHFTRVGLFRRHVADEVAVAEYRHAVGELLHLVQLVRDYDYGLAVVAHVAQYGEELVRLLRSQHRRRLVEDEDVRAAIQNLDYLDGLLL